MTPSKAASIFLIVFLTALTGCKDKTTGLQWRTIADKSAVFKVAVDAVVEEDDTFRVYYTTDGSINFTENQSVEAAVKGNADTQKITFDLPPKLHPTALRIDLGRSQDQKEILLSRVFLSYEGKMLELPGTLIFSYFRADISKTEFDATTGIVKGKIISGIRQSPSLYPKEGPLGEKIEELINQ